MTKGTLRPIGQKVWPMGTYALIVYMINLTLVLSRQSPSGTYRQHSILYLVSMKYLHQVHSIFLPVVECVIE